MSVSPLEATPPASIKGRDTSSTDAPSSPNAPTEVITASRTSESTSSPYIFSLITPTLRLVTPPSRAAR